MRNAFIDELVMAAEVNPKIALVVGDLGFGVVEPFSKKFPERFFNAGVAEQNMMGLSAGIASEGFHVFVYSIANFPTFRCAEQIRNDIDYHNLSVTIVAVGGGLSYGNMGYSHHAIQDYALMRCMPNILIAAPGDPMETRACMKYLIKNPQPSYLRLGKAGEPIIHKEIPDIKPGMLVPVISNPSKKKSIITTGATLELAKKWVESESKYNDFSLYSMPLWGMKWKEKQIEQLKNCKSLLTLEDHLIDGGFGSWLLESVRTDKSILSAISLKGLSPEICGMVAQQSLMNELGGLTP